MVRTKQLMIMLGFILVAVLLGRAIPAWTLSLATVAAAYLLWRWA